VNFGRAGLSIWPHGWLAPAGWARRRSHDDEIATRNALEAELDGLEQQYADAEEVPEKVDRRLGEIETALEALNDRPVVYDPAEVTYAGAFVSIDRDGNLRIERGCVRPEDELPVEPVQAKDQEAPPNAELSGKAERGVITVGAGGTTEREAEEDDGLKPLSERLITELTAHRTVALRDALANDPDTASMAVLHALCLSAFYRFSSGSCLEISAKSASFGTQAPGLADSTSAKAIEVRHQQWASSCPRARRICGTRWRRSMATAGQPCSPTAHRSASMPCMSRGAATHGDWHTPTRWRVP
jgi:ParB family transcriptional regulator, chromosome partitioning protein